MSGLKLKVTRKLPGQVTGGAGIDAEKHNGNWTVTLDYAEFGLVSPYTPKANDHVLVYDGSGYFLVRSASLFS
jgi:hypothetical protein